MNDIILSNTAITIDLDQVWRGLLTLSGVAVIVAFALLILKIMGTIKRINHLVDTLTPSIKLTVDQLPQTVGHLNAISGNIEDLSTEISTKVPALLNDVEDISGIAVDMVDNFADVLNEVTEMFSSLLAFIQKPLAKSAQVTKVAKGVGQAAGILKRFKQKKK